MLFSYFVLGLGILLAEACLAMGMALHPGCLCCASGETPREHPRMALGVVQSASFASIIRCSFCG